MFIKNKIIRWIVYVALAGAAVYTGISSVATFIKAFTQAYLTNGETRFVFMGYYIMASVFGVLCLAAVTLLVIFIIRNVKKK